MLKKSHINFIISVLALSSIPILFLRDDPSYFYGLIIDYASFYLLYRFGKINFFSFNFLILTTFLFFYPVVAQLTIYYEYFYGEFEWLQFNHEALLAVAVFIIPYGIAYNTISSIRENKVAEFSGKDHSKIALLLLFSVWFVALLIRVKFDIYFHISVDGNYAVNTGEIQNLVDKLHVVGLAAIPISLVAFYKNKKGNNLIVLVAFLTISMVAYIPSGSRTLVIAHLPPILIILISLYKRQAAKIILLSVVSMFAFIILLGNLRVSEESKSANFEEAAGVLIHRLGDFRNTGKIIDEIPAQKNFRGAVDLDKIWQIYIPYFERKYIKEPLDLNEGANVTQDLGIAAGPWTSEPITLIGDFYSRFAWLGILFGGALVGIGVGVLDKILYLLPREVAIIVFFLHSRFIFQFYTSSALVVTVSFLREALISIVLGLIVATLVYRRAR